MRKIFLFLFIFILLVSPLSAINPQFQQSTEGIDIDYPKYTTLQQDKPADFIFHIYNSSNGVYLYNNSLSCTFILINTNTTDITKFDQTSNNLNFSYLSDGHIYKARVNKSKLGNLGTYAATFECNDSVKGGYSSFSFEVTTDGKESVSTARTVTYVSELSVLFLIFFITVGGIFMLPATNTRNEEGELMSINNLKYLRSVLFAFAWGILLMIIFLSIHIADLTLLGASVSNLFLNLYRLMMGLTLIMFVVWMIWLFVNIFQDRELKKMLDRGIEMGGEP